MPAQHHVYFPLSESEICEAVRKARESGQSIHCYSGGFNWGYGTKSTLDENAIHLDLSGMDKILSFDPKLGIIRIQPGVTQEILEKYLEDHQLPFYVPTTGAGRRGSILGNALERGFGISPVHDHAASILSVRGVLGDGSVYRSGFDEINPRLSECFHWGVGPQLDKLVTQSSWIIITEASIQLKKKHPRMDILLLSFADTEIPSVMESVATLMSEDDGHIGSIKIFNKNQIVDQGFNQFHKDFFKNSDWYMTVVVYSHPETRRGVLKLVKKTLRQSSVKRMTCLDERKISLLRWLLNKLPFQGLKEYSAKLGELNEFRKLADGKSSEVGYRALDINFDYASGKAFDFNGFRKKLTWLSPLCPLVPEDADRLLKLLRSLNTHPDFRFNTFTWTVLNPRTLAMVVPVLYDEAKEEEFWPWYQEIHRKLKAEGFIPYRFHIKMMEMLRTELMPEYFQHVKRFEKAMDPEERILNGRY